MPPDATPPGAIRRRPHHRVAAAALTALVGLATLAPASAAGQETPSEALLEAVLPAADRFGPLEGDPPVRRGWARDPATGKETLVGFAFLTSDIPPEELGYSGPVDVLVGMDPDGVITGITVVDYYESLRSSRGDFLARRGFQEQYAGKTIGDAFRVRRDIDGISGATITVSAMSRGIRNAARRVWSAHVLGPTAAAAGGAPPEPAGADALRRLSWLDLAARGLLQKMNVEDEGVTRIEITFLRILDEEAGRVLLGADAYAKAVEEAGEEKSAGAHRWMLGVDGALTALFRSQALFVVQDGDTVRMGGKAVMLGEPRAGKASAQFRNAGVLFVDATVDPARPFTFLLDLNNGWGAFTAEYPGEPSAVVAEAPAPSTGREGSGGAGGSGATSAGAGGAGTPDARAAPDAGAPDTPPSTSDSAAEVAPATGSAPAGEPDADEAVDDDAVDAGGGRPATPLPFQIEDEADESVLARTLDRTSWPRVAVLAALLALASAAFASKRRPALRWATLAATLLVLGVGGGFLSVSHLVATLKVGPGVFLEDLPLFLLAGFTLITTLLWGRVFCGYLCPFGALQDVLERVVPRRFRRELPPAVHEKALLAKYGVLAFVLLPAAAGSQVSLFQYVEPFGTVFFLSASTLLWAIALGILAASAVVPRFYCRYACPLGASLALGSLLSPFRIRRVEQCTLCVVCENACPTGAIRRERIDFKECVRCNVCERALQERVGVCRHDMADVHRRLVQIEVGAGRGAHGR